MTIQEASQLVLQAGTMGRGGEIFILDMGDPIRILDLARDAIWLSGLKPYEDIEIVFTGVRPGEKLFEELDMKEEQVSRTRHPKIFIGKIAAYPSAKIVWALDRLKCLSQSGDELALREFLTSLLPEAQLDSSGNRKAEIVEIAEARQVG
jgi:FlaA1/EpsC-like NDP-sugar epimerase